MKNKKYESDGLFEMYSVQRNSWEEFYDSERQIMESTMSGLTDFSVLDAGCGCGGLLKAIQGKFDVKRYLGIDVNEKMITYANNRTDYCIDHDFRCIDICDLKDELFDIVVSFSCVDWNEDVLGMLNNCWDRVQEGGCLIASFRLTDQESIMHEAYQTLGSYSERYNYVVFNFCDLKKTLCNLSPLPSELDCFGYWGTPSKTAVVDRDRLCFSVFAIHKSKEDYCEVPRIRLDLPADIL